LTHKERVSGPASASRKRWQCNAACGVRGKTAFHKVGRLNVVESFDHRPAQMPLNPLAFDHSFFNYSDAAVALLGKAIVMSTTTPPSTVLLNTSFGSLVTSFMGIVTTIRAQSGPL
jgi:hypothetical protein